MRIRFGCGLDSRIYGNMCPIMVGQFLTDRGEGHAGSFQILLPALDTTSSLFVLADNSKMKVVWILLTACVSGTSTQHPIWDPGITDSMIVV